MFRRRRLLSTGRVMSGGHFLVERMIADAQHALGQGQYAQAAEIFEQLAEGAVVRDRPRAPQLFIRSAQARLLQGEPQWALELVLRGLVFLAEARRWSELQLMGKRAETEFRQYGADVQAEELAAWVVQRLPAITQAPPPPIRKKKEVRLPLTCSGCGGNLVAAELKWVDEETVTCAYCGRLVRGEVEGN